MAFLDNSGDIILDAVLTDLGRERMARGNFRITKFALGDDEIDYGLYNKNSPSGSAYYDLQILQTPVMEAFSDTNAGINYGLLTATTTNLLYLPSLKINNKALDGNVRPPLTHRGLYFVASTANNTLTKLAADSVTDQNATTSGQTSGRAILLEAGLNTTDILGTTANKKTYLVENNLIDKWYFVYYDNRFISSVLGPAGGTKFNNTEQPNGVLTMQVSLKQAPRISTDLQLENYSAAKVQGITDNVIYSESLESQVPDTQNSIIAGPRSTCLMLNVTMNPNLATEYAKYGSTNTLLAGGAGSQLYDFLDTTLYVQGANTGIQTQIPLRLIKYKSG